MTVLARLDAKTTVKNASGSSMKRLMKKKHNKNDLYSTEAVMIKVLKDLTGQRFGKLVVIEQAEDFIEKNGCHRAQWLCKCDCGNQRIVIGSRLTRKKQAVISCGCMNLKRGGQHRKINQYDLSGEYGIGWTSNTNKEFYFDFEDYDKIKDYCWYEYTNKKTGYHSLRTRERGSRKSILMTSLLGYSYYDHIDRNTLNCTRKNLRPSTHRENARNKSKHKYNTSGVTGVYWDKRLKKWFARICVNYKRIYLGYFNDKEDAIRVRLQAEAHYFKEFAPQKNLFDKYNIITE